MQKTWIFRLVVALVAVVMLAAGCSTKNAGEDGSSDISNTDSNPFELDDKDTVVLGHIGHGLANPELDETGARLPLRYSGGELKLDYTVNAAGKAKNVGFLVFVDGIPQPYKINTADSPYEYMHIFELEGDDVQTPFSFIFTPVTGKQGETLSVSIASVYNPAFIPDMKETSSYGSYHDTLESMFSLIFDKDAEALDVSSIPHNEYLSDVRLSAELITKEMMETQGGFVTIDLETLEKNVFSRLYFDGAVLSKIDNLQVKDSGTLHVTFQIFGHPGVRYRNTFYINHKPLIGKEGSTFETVLAKGEAAVIDADIDLGKLEELNTFYVVSVPVNAADFPDDVVVLEKTASILLYK